MTAVPMQEGTADVVLILPTVRGWKLEVFCESLRCFSLKLFDLQGVALLPMTTVPMQEGTTEEVL